MGERYSKLLVTMVPIVPYGTLKFLDSSDSKASPTIWETWVRSLGQEDPLEKEIATYSSTLAWKIQWTEEHGRLQYMGLQRVGHD